MSKVRRVGGRPKVGKAPGPKSRIDLNPQAGAQLARLAELHGQAPAEVLGRAVRWLVRQDEVVQLAVLGAVSERSLAVLADDALSRCAKEGS